MRSLYGAAVGCPRPGPNGWVSLRATGAPWGSSAAGRWIKPAAEAGSGGQTRKYAVSRAMSRSPAYSDACVSPHRQSAFDAIVGGRLK